MTEEENKENKPKEVEPKKGNPVVKKYSDIRLRSVRKWCDTTAFVGGKEDICRVVIDEGKSRELWD